VDAPDGEQIRDGADRDHLAGQVSMTPTGNEAGPTLVVIRGNSGSGKSTAAREVRARYGRGCALVEQDYLRRIVLREHGSSSTPLVAPGFITTVARAALASGYHVVLEGILDSRGYGPLLRELIAEHAGPVHVFWLQVSFEETMRRHAGRPDMSHVTEQMMRGWYTDRDLLGVPGEQIIGEESGFEETVTTILHAGGLNQVEALTPCPVLCPRCTQKTPRSSLPTGGGM
jgi:predicted kinase